MPKTQIKIEAHSCDGGSSKRVDLPPYSQLKEILENSRRLIDDYLHKSEPLGHSGDCQTTTSSARINSNIELELGDCCPYREMASFTEERLTVNDKVLCYNIIKDPEFVPSAGHVVIPKPNVMDMDTYKRLREESNPLKVNLKIRAADEVKGSEQSRRQKKDSLIFELDPLDDNESDTGAKVSEEVVRNISFQEFVKVLEEKRPYLEIVLNCLRENYPHLVEGIEEQMRGVEQGDENALVKLVTLAKGNPVFMVVFEDLVKAVVSRVKDMEKKQVRRIPRVTGVSFEGEASSLQDVPVKRIDQVEPLNVDRDHEMSIRFPKNDQETYTSIPKRVNRIHRPDPQNIQVESHSKEIRRKAIEFNEYEAQMFKFLKIPESTLYFSEIEVVKLIDEDKALMDEKLSKTPHKAANEEHSQALEGEIELLRLLQSYQEKITANKVNEIGVETDILERKNKEEQATLTDPLPPFRLNSRIVNFHYSKNRIPFDGSKPISHRVADYKAELLERARGQEYSFSSQSISSIENSHLTKQQQAAHFPSHHSRPLHHANAEHNIGTANHYR